MNLVVDSEPDVNGNCAAVAFAVVADLFRMTSLSVGDFFKADLLFIILNLFASFFNSL